MDQDDRQPTVALPSDAQAATVDRLLVDAVAKRVVELIHAVSPAAKRALVDAATLAAELGVTRSWVYEHQHQLHPIRLGEGTKARLRFDVEAIRRELDAQARQPVPDQAPDSRRGRVGVRASRSAHNRPTVGGVLAVRPRQAR